MRSNCPGAEQNTCPPAHPHNCSLPHREWFEPGSRAGGSDSLLALWAAGGLGGAVSWLSVYPFDVVKTRCQAAGAAQSPYSGEVATRY